jgi:putative transposase
MSRNYYSEINLHIIWHAKNSSPLLTPAIESLAQRVLRKRIADWPGAFIHDIGGTETHVHLAVTLAPTILISEFIGQLKGGSSHDVNQKLGQSLEWQAGYGVVSFGTRDLPWVLDYIHRQREHHASASLHDRLERLTHDEDHGSSRAARRPVNGPRRTRTASPNPA